jgi:F0F1-type ATP synthase delta subunit
MGKLSLALAQALYLTAKDKDREGVKDAVARFIESVARRFGSAELPRVLAAMPKAIRVVDEIEDISVETAHEMKREAVDGLVESLGIDRERADIKVKVVPELISGARVRRRGSVTDMSARGALDRLTGSTS